MDDFVPEFHGIQDIYEIPTSSSAFSRHKKPAQGEEDIMELMWQNGQVVAQKPSKKSPFQSEEAVVKEIRSSEQEQQHLFMQEDEMASWLHYPLDHDHDCSSFDHRDLYGSDLLNSAPSPPPPLPVPTNPPPIPPRPQNFGHFSRIPGRPMMKSSVFDPNDNTAAQRPESRELDRKRKGTEADVDKENQSHSEDIDFEAGEAKKQAKGSGSASTKRSRASQVHNLSERRRRDRINEKMKALQELIPRCNKVDKASMLDEAIEYLKSLQMQVQMMSMGCGMIPMMYPGMHQYMPAMGMGMGMGMGMDIGMNRPMVPYPSMIPASSIPNPAAAHVGHTFPMQAFQLPPLRAPDSSQIQASNQTYPTLNSFIAHNPNQPRFPNFVDPYQQFHGLYQAQVPLPQNQEVMLQPSASAPSTSKETVNPETRQTG